MSGPPVPHSLNNRFAPPEGDRPEKGWAREDDQRALAEAFVQMDDGQKLGKSFVETEHTKLKDPKGSRRHLGWLWAAVGFISVGLMAVFLGWLPRHKRDKEVQARRSNSRRLPPLSR